MISVVNVPHPVSRGHHLYVDSIVGDSPWTLHTSDTRFLLESRGENQEWWTLISRIVMVTREKVSDRESDEILAFLHPFRQI